ncbi:MAG TPA: Thivi_2564 family membrane protein [Candidatus Solibacter sp.]|jgi:predicted membrane protein|nr:Thivi_2564 family membrane protein [Candidatus Solibacter sp.]
MPLVRTLLYVVIALVVVGVALWAIDTYVPMAGSIRALLNVVVFLATCVGVLQAFGLWTPVQRVWNNLTHRV